MVFRLRIAAGRAGREMTLVQVADALKAAGHDVGPGAVGHWETGARVPSSLARVRALAGVLGLDADTVVNEWALALDEPRRSPEATAGA